MKMTKKLQQPKRLSPLYHIKAKYEMTPEERESNFLTKKAGLHPKHTDQIAEMLTSHVLKISSIKDKLKDRKKYPQYLETIKRIFNINRRKILCLM